MIENRTKFLDILFNESFIDFDVLIKKVLQDLGLSNYGYSYYKKNDNYLIEVEKEDQLVSILFNDYFMVKREGRFRKIEDISAYWNGILKQSVLFGDKTITEDMFKGLLNKKQKAEYNRNLREYKALLDNNVEMKEEDIQRELNF